MISLIANHLLVPKIQGMEKSQFQDWYWRDANKRKVIHIMCNKEEVGRVQDFFEVAKEKSGARENVGQEC